MLKYWGRDKYFNGILSKSRFMCPANARTICSDYSEEEGRVQEMLRSKQCHLLLFSGSLVTVGQLPVFPVFHQRADTVSVWDNWIIGMGSYFRHRTFLKARVTRAAILTQESSLTSHPGKIQQTAAGAKTHLLPAFAVSLFVSCPIIWNQLPTLGQ